MTPGERFHNWARAFMTLWPAWVFILGLLGYTNADHLRDWAGIAEADGKTEIAADGLTFEQSVEKFSREVRDELVRIERNSAAIRQQMQDSDKKTLESLQAQIDSLQATISKWHD
jgi:hypothetical protein